MEKVAKSARKRAEQGDLMSSPKGSTGGRKQDSKPPSIARSFPVAKPFSGIRAPPNVMLLDSAQYAITGNSAELIESEALLKLVIEA